MTLEEAIGLVIEDLGNIRVPVSEVEISSRIAEAIANLGECVKAIQRNRQEEKPEEKPAEQEGGGEVV